MKSRDLKKILNSNEAYSILDSSPGAGGTWTAGGCCILANALKEYCPGGEIHVVFNEEWGQAEHFVYKTKQGYIDGAGIHSAPVLMRQMKELEGIKQRISIKPYQRGMRAPGVPCTRQTAHKLAELFKHKRLDCQ
jgi:hypothetical protein